MGRERAQALSETQAQFGILTDVKQTELTLLLDLHDPSRGQGMLRADALYAKCESYSLT